MKPGAAVAIPRVTGINPPGLIRVLAFMLLAAFFPSILTAQPVTAGRVLNIMLIASYGKDNPATRELESGLDQSLQFSKGRHNLFGVYLDTPLLSESEATDHLADHLKNKFTANPPDYIIAWAPAAYRFMIANPDLFPDSKRIYLETLQNEPTGSEIKQRGTTWLEVHNDFNGSLQELKRFYHPDRIYVIGETGNKAADDRHYNFNKALAAEMPGVEAIYLDDLPVRGILDRLNGDKRSKSVAYFLLQFRDGAEYMTPFRLLERIAKGSQIPVFSYWDSHMDSGIVGGVLFSHRVVGSALGAALLTGTPVNGELPIKTTTISYDWQAMRHWNLNTELVPRDAIIINHPVSLLYTYRYWLLVFMLAIAALLFLSLTLARTVNARNLALQQLEEERNSLSRKVELRTQELASSLEDLQGTNMELQKHIDEIRTLKGIIPICSFCKKVRNDKGYWDLVESYISSQTDARFSHGICPECAEREYHIHQ